MKRYIETNEDGKGLTLEELRNFLKVADEMGFSDATRVRVKAKFSGSLGARVNEISIDGRDRVGGTA